MPAMPASNAKVTRFLFLSLLFASLSAAAERSVRIGEYAAEVRSRVVAKVREALEADARQAEISGTVTSSANGAFFLQKDADGLKVLASGPLPKSGETVRVVGVPSLEGGRVVFVSKEWKSLGRQPLPAARKAGKEDLIDGDGTSVNWLRVEIEGRAMGLTEGGFVLNIDEVPVNVFVSPVPDFIRDCDRVHPKVRVMGVVELMLDPSALTGKEGYVIGIKLNLPSPKDVILIPDAAYWAARHERVVARVVTVLLIVLAIGLLVFVVVIFRQRKGLFRTQTIMAERKRMADDIHDTIEQHLVGAGMLLKINRLKEAQDVLVRAKREIRDIVWGLKNDDMMRLTPAEMLRELAHEENTKGLFRVDTKLEGLPERLEASAMRDLSLIVRETIGNAVKHGGAKRIAISADPKPDGGWLLRVSNDGEPFDPDSVPGAAEGHFGIEGMKQRARRLGATVSLERRGKGMVMILDCRNMV